MNEARSIRIREERPEDIDAIRALNLAAFGQVEEGRIVDALRAKGGVLLSLVATMGERVIGHALYSPVSIDSKEATLQGAGLGPMAVLPEFQRRGVGARLITFGIERLKERGIPFIVVVGHPEYYPRLGFRPASGLGIRSEWELPDDVFMVLPLDESKMKGVSGLATYRPEFSDAS